MEQSEYDAWSPSPWLIEAHFGIDVATPPKQLTQLYDSIFDKFDNDQSRTVDLEEFKKEMKKIRLAIANGFWRTTTRKKKKEKKKKKKKNPKRTQKLAPNQVTSAFN
ncbi:hypothetical protein FF1_045793 [Malus domestica]